MTMNIIMNTWKETTCTRTSIGEPLVVGMQTPRLRKGKGRGLGRRGAAGGAPRAPEYVKSNKGAIKRILI
jgi:hypothetical protein